MFLDQSAFRLTEQLLDKLALRGDAVDVPRGTRLISEGEESDTLYILLSGRLEVFTTHARKRKLVYNVLEPGELFGELTLDGGRRTASVEALVASRCVLIDRDRLDSFIVEYPEFCKLLVLKLIARVRHCTQQIKSISFESAYERIAVLIRQCAVETEWGPAIPKGMTQGEIAGRVGVTREMVNMVLRDLTRRGYLMKNGKRQLIIVKALPAQL